MRNVALLMTLLALLFLGMGTAVAAQRESNMEGLYWKQQCSAVKGVLRAYRAGGTNLDNADALRELVASEAGLMAYGVPGDDGRLRCRLSSGVPDYWPLANVLAYRIVKEELSALGFKVGDPRATFRFLKTTVTEAGDDDPARVRF